MISKEKEKAEPNFKATNVTVISKVATLLQKAVAGSSSSSIQFVSAVLQKEKRSYKPLLLLREKMHFQKNGKVKRNIEMEETGEIWGSHFVIYDVPSCARTFCFF